LNIRQLFAKAFGLSGKGGTQNEGKPAEVVENNPGYGFSETILMKMRPFIDFRAPMEEAAKLGI
jgi:hypothetical protein